MIEDSSTSCAGFFIYWAGVEPSSLLLRPHWPFVAVTDYRWWWFWKTNSVAFSPQAKCTDWSTAACWRNLVPNFADRAVSRGSRGESPTVVNLSFVDRDFGKITGMMDWQGKLQCSERTCPVPQCPSQIPYDLIRARTRATAAGSWLPTAWGIAKPCCYSTSRSKNIKQYPLHFYDCRNKYLMLLIWIC
jgi:hypothetical protein